MRKNYTYTNDRAAIETLLARGGDHTVVYEAAKQTTAYLRSHFCDNTNRISGWGHNYVCPKCAAQMTFAPDTVYPPAVPFRCPSCGTEASGTDLNEAWVYLSKAERTVTINGDTVTDTTVLESATVHTFDWLFHCRGNAVYSYDGEPTDTFASVPFYTDAEVRHGKTVTVTVADNADGCIYTAHSPDNPADHLRHTVILRQTGNRAVFTVTYTIE